MSVSYKAYVAGHNKPVREPLVDRVLRVLGTILLVVVLVKYGLPILLALIMAIALTGAS